MMLKQVHQNLKLLMTATFNGIAQVTFIDNWLYGLIVGCCIFLMNIECGIAIFTSSLFTNFLSLKVFDKKAIAAGLHSFNSVILMLLIYALFGGLRNLLFIFPITIFCFLLYYLLSQFLGRFEISAFALPAVFTAYLLYLVELLYPNLLFTQSTYTLLHEVTRNFHSGVLEHFIINVGDVYLQLNLLFSIILLICYFFIQKEYLLYIIVSFVVAYLVYFSMQWFLPINLATFPTFNIILGMMCARTLGVLTLDKNIIYKLSGLTILIMLVDMLLNQVLSVVNLPVMTMPFMLSCYGIVIWKKYAKIKLKKTSNI